MVSSDAAALSEADLLSVSEAFAAANTAMGQSNSTRSRNAAAAAEAEAMQMAEQLETGTSTITFDTIRVGEMDVVSREDAIKIGQQSAKQAESNVFKSLKNMPAMRSRVGVK